MTWEPRPLPEVTPETAPFWNGAAGGQLLLQECAACGLVYYYPRALCPDCLSDDVEWIEANGTGQVYTYSVSEHVAGWPEEYLPIVVAYVQLDEGPRMMTNVVNCDPGDVTVGARVEVRFEETNEAEIAVPVFTLA